MNVTYQDYEWFLKQDLSEYAGKWLAIINKTVVGFDVNVERLVSEVKKKYPTQKPLITRIKNKLSVL